MDYADYKAYLQSDKWRKIRQEVLGRAGGVCEERGCHRRAWQIHHITYDRLGDEGLDDLLALCGDCHQAKHPEKQKTPDDSQEKALNLVSRIMDGTVCDEDFRAVSKVKKRKVVCPPCERAFRDLWSWWDHAKAVHPSVIRDEWGRREGERMGDWRRRLLGTPQKIVCGHCKGRFSGERGLQSHTDARHPGKELAVG